MLKPGEIRACLEEAFSAETGAPGICCHLRFGWKPGRTVWSIRCGKTGELTAEVNLRMTEGNRFSEPEEQMRYLRFLSRYGAGRLSGMARAQTAVPESYLEGLAILEDLETAERCCVLDLYLPGEKRPCGKFRFGPADLLAVMAAQRETGYKAVPEILCELPEICYTKPARPVSSLLWMLDAKAELTRKYPQAPVVQSLADGGNPFGAGVLLRMGGSW